MNVNYFPNSLPKYNQDLQCSTVPTHRWNFSVGEHQLALSARGCGGGGGGSGPATDYQLGLALPEGVVAVRRPGSQLLLWKQKVTKVKLF